MTPPSISPVQYKTLNRAIDTYGQEPQIRMCLEEMTELSYALLKWLRKPDDEKVGNIIDELADVRVTVAQMELMFGQDEVQERIDFKVDRLQKRLEKGNDEIR